MIREEPEGDMLVYTQKEKNSSSDEFIFSEMDVCDQQCYSIYLLAKTYTELPCGAMRIVVGVARIQGFCC